MYVRVVRRSCTAPLDNFFPFKEYSKKCMHNFLSCISSVDMCWKSCACLRVRAARERVEDGFASARARTNNEAWPGADFHRDA